MAEYFMACIITDSEMKKMSDTSDEIQIVKRENLTPEMMNDYVPFNGAAVKDEEDHFGRIIQRIEGDKNKVTVSGVTMVGVMPIPFSQEYVVGENFTADNIFEVSTDGSVKKEGFAKIEKIILSKTKTDLNEIINYYAEVNAAHGRPVMYAEESSDYRPPAATMAAEDETDFFGAEYEQHLIKMAHSLYPLHRMYEANV